VAGGPVSITGFTSPLWFLLLFGVLALLVGYLIVLRLRRRYVVRFANLGLLEEGGTEAAGVGPACSDRVVSGGVGGVDGGVGRPHRGTQGSP